MLPGADGMWSHYMCVLIPNQNSREELDSKYILCGSDEQELL